jgi:Fe-S-cluster-containing hydrogenase component 2
MNPDRLSQAITSMATGLRQTPSRCLRRRFKKNDCRQCLQICPAQAIAIDDRDVAIAADRCSECLLCAAACPTEAIAPKANDFLRLLDDLADLPHPVVSCRRKEKLAGHSTFGCAGFYSHEHLLAMAFLLPTAVQLNLTACAGCPSRMMLPTLRRRHRELEEMIPAYRGRVLLIEEIKELRFSTRSIGRRELFAFWGRSAKQETARFLLQLEPEDRTGSFAEKSLPRRRQLLNLICQTRPELSALFRPFFFHSLQADATCNCCRACVSICPTGALRRGEGRTLLFKSKLCTGCGLCVEFCPRASLRLHSGYGPDPAAATVISAHSSVPASNRPEKIAFPH